MPEPTRIPPPLPADHEDVSWALSTAEANWKRGDHADALKWLRRAAEAASEAGADARYLELAKAVSELAQRIESSPRGAGTETPPPSGATLIEAPTALPNAPVGSKSPPPLPADRKLPPRASTPPPAPSGSKLPPAAPSRPSVAPRPAQVASNQPPPNRTSSKAPAAARSAPAPSPSSPSASPSKALSGGSASPGPAASAAGGSAPSKTSSQPRTLEGAPSAEHLRTVRNLDKIAHLAQLTRSPGDAISRRPEPEDLTQLTPVSAIPATEIEPPVDLLAGDSGEYESVESSALTSDSDPLARTRLNAAPEPPPTGRLAEEVARSGASPAAESRPAHDRPSQAIRVLLYRTADGVRIAPVGTKVQAMCIEAMVVALDPSADLTSWLK